MVVTSFEEPLIVQNLAITIIYRPLCAVETLVVVTTDFLNFFPATVRPTK